MVGSEPLVPKVWNGTDFIDAPEYVWDGSDFVAVSTGVWDDSDFVGGATPAPPLPTQTISTLNTIWTADSGLSRSGDDIISWTSDTGLRLTVSVAGNNPFYDAAEFASLPGVNFNGNTTRSFKISQADLDPDPATALELVQPYTVFIVLNRLAQGALARFLTGLTAQVEACSDITPGKQKCRSTQVGPASIGGQRR